MVNRAVIIHIEPQPPGFGLPAKATGSCQCVEIELGEPAAATALAAGAALAPEEAVTAALSDSYAVPARI